MDLNSKLQLKPGQTISVLEAPADLDLGLAGRVRAVVGSQADALLALVARSALRCKPAFRDR